MTLIFKYTLLTSCFLLFTNVIKSQEEVTQEKYPETVVIKLIETFSSGMISPVGSRMVTVTPDNSVETKALERADIIHGGKEEVEQNLVKLKIELQRWHNQGFQVKSTAMASPGDFITITTIILSKN